MTNVTPAFLQSVGIRKTYGEGEYAVEVLRGIDLTIRQGEFVAIMGPSGSGKSTLLSILGGIELPSEGKVLLEGVDLVQMNDTDRTLLRRRRIGFIFQAFNLIPTITALENVSLPLELDGVRTHLAQERARMTLAKLELEHRRDHLPSKLSGGEQQRVAIARALVMDPAVLLADEPTGNLDSRQSHRIVEILANLVRQGQTLVMVTHDPTIAASATRQVSMRDGVIEKDLSLAGTSTFPPESEAC